MIGSMLKYRIMRGYLQPYISSDYATCTKQMGYTQKLYFCTTPLCYEEYTKVLIWLQYAFT